MKIKISKILLVLSVCGLLYSCDKFFEVDLKEQMDEELLALMERWEQLSEEAEG